MLRTSSKSRRGQVQIAGTRLGRPMHIRPAPPPFMLRGVGGRCWLCVCVVGRALVRVP